MIQRLHEKLKERLKVKTGSSWKTKRGNRCGWNLKKAILNKKLKNEPGNFYFVKLGHFLNSFLFYCMVEVDTDCS